MVLKRDDIPDREHFAIFLPSDRELADIVHVIIPVRYHLA
jgi:hypothetical protein